MWKMQTHFEQVPLESVKRMLEGGEGRNAIQMPIRATGARTNNPDGFPDMAGQAFPKWEKRQERWRELAEAASLEKDTRTLLKLVQDLVRELPGPDPVQRKPGYLGTE
jgi:hypothetical protein